MIKLIDLIAMIIILFLMYKNKTEKFCGLCGKM